MFNGSFTDTSIFAVYIVFSPPQERGITTFPSGKEPKKPKKPQTQVIVVFSEPKNKNQDEKNPMDKLSEPTFITQLLV